MRKMKILLGLILFSIIIVSLNVNSALVLKEPNQLIDAFKNNSLVRLHIIANSNSPADQYLKRKIRNQLTTYIGKFPDKENIVLEEKIDEIDKYINSILEVEGVNYKAQIELGSYYFPDRTYDNLTLPAGRYKALKVVLGKGKGANWWCVLLPPMCIEDQKNGNFADQKIEFRFKIFEWFMEKKKGDDEKEVDTVSIKNNVDDKKENIKNEGDKINNNLIKVDNLYLSINETRFYDLINKYNLSENRFDSSGFNLASMMEDGSRTLITE